MKEQIQKEIITKDDGRESLTNNKSTNNNQSKGITTTTSSSTSSAFYRTTKKGKLLKIVREVYLRDDILCGHSKCVSCQQKLQQSNKHNTIEAINRFKDLVTFVESDDILLLDTNVVLHQIDLLEDPTIKNVIILTTVLEEVKNRNFTIYNRIRDIIKDKDRLFYVYSNEHSIYTSLRNNQLDESSRGSADQQAIETPNDRNDRAIRVATQWYKSHLHKLGIRVTLITNDIDNLKKSKALGMDAKTIKELVYQLSDKHPELVDKLSIQDDNDGDQDMNTTTTPTTKFQYSEHKSINQITEELNQGKIYQGILRVDQTNYHQATVQCNLKSSKKQQQKQGEEEEEEEIKDILIKGIENINRGVDGDIVVIEILPKSQWSGASSIILMDGQGVAEDDDSLVQDAIKKQDLTQPCGKVVGIIKRNWKPYCGMVEFNSTNNINTNTVQNLIFTPIDKRIPRIRIKSRQVSNLIGRRIVVAIDSWDKNSKLPNGHFVKDLGPIGDKETESQVLLLQYDIPHHPFGDAVMKCLPRPDIMDHLTEADMIGRKDLRDLCVFSVDPPGCTDIDDALHVIKLDDGTYQVGVHIADVSHFVREGTAIDLEASHRSTTVYLVDRRIDMLPTELSSNLCSLISNVDRFTFSCIWKMDSDGNVLDVEYTKSIIKSCASLTYEQAQIRIDDKQQQDPVAQNLRHLLMLSKKLKQKRFEQGALMLASPQVKFKTEELGGDPSDVELYQLRETNSMIEEFMLLANIWVAKKIHKHFPSCALLRRHPTPRKDSFDLLTQLIAQKGIKFDTSTSKLLSESLDKCILDGDSYFNTLCRIMTTRCMSPAVYFSSGSLPYEDYRHYGLASEIYTHFTSPIRRYPDVIVHRLLASSIGVESVSLNMDNKNISQMTNGFNKRHKSAQFAGRGSTTLHTLIFFKNRKTVELAYIIRVKANAFVVLVPRYGFEGTVYLVNSDNDAHGNQNNSAAGGFVYDSNNQILENPTTKQTFRVFDQVQVEIFVDDSKLHDQKLRIICLNPKIEITPLSTTTNTNVESKQQPTNTKKNKTIDNDNIDKNNNNNTRVKKQKVRK